MQALPPIDSVVEDGMMIALAGVRLSIKNFIIVSALRDHLPYEAERVVSYGLSQLEDLATSHLVTSTKLETRSREDAALVFELEADQLHHAARQRAPAVHGALARALNEFLADPLRVSHLVEEARAQASDEIGTELSRKLISQLVEADEDYSRQRSKRLRKLIKTDLKSLRSRQ